MNPAANPKSRSGVAASERRTARRAWTVFLAVALVCTAQVTWWIIFQVGQAERMGQMQAAALEAERFRLAYELDARYTRLWYVIDSVVSTPDWNGGFPRTILQDDAVREIRRLPPISRTMPSRFGQVRSAAWYWSIAVNPPDSVWVVLAADFPARIVERQAPDLEFTGDPPAAGPVAWRASDPPIRIRPEKLDDIAHEQGHTTLMFASEGAFFVLLIIIGAYYIYRSVHQSADLRRRQQNFIAAVTHELKAPLASVKLYAETLERPEIERADQARYLQRMLEDIARLEHLIDNTLLAGRLEEKGFHLELKRTDLSRDLQEYVDTMRGYLDRHRFELRTDIQPDVEAVTDYEAMRRVVTSLVENAVKYSNERREADLHLSRDGSTITMRLCDYGTGIPPGEIERVFDAFYRVGDEMTRKIQGSGLGLYLVREIIAAHGGAIQLKSGGQDEGTQVFITLRSAT